MKALNTPLMVNIFFLTNIFAFPHVPSEFFENYQKNFNFNEFWNSALLTIYNKISIEENGHISPDFSNGLDYPDPHLLRAELAKRVVPFLYSRGLYFQDIPHIKLLLAKQGERRSMGLSGNVLGSLRPSSPFYRDRLHRIIIYENRSKIYN